jgi:hypothetical protein
MMVATLGVEHSAVDHGLLHGLKYLSLHHQNLFQGRWWVDSVVVLSIVVFGIGVVVSCVDYLKN